MILSLLPKQFGFISLLPISDFVLDGKFKRNTSKFAIFKIYKNPKLHEIKNFSLSTNSEIGSEE